MEMNKYKMEVELWKKTATILEGYIGVPKEKILEGIERSKKIKAFIKPM